MNSVDRLKNDFEAIAKHLAETVQVSMLNDLNSSFRKLLLLSAGSYFEHEITQVLMEFARKKAHNDERLSNFLQKAAVAGRYHTFFEWGKQDQVDGFGKNANKFWSYFGAEFKNQMVDELKDKPEINKSIT